MHVFNWCTGIEPAVHCSRLETHESEGGRGDQRGGEQQGGIEWAVVAWTALLHYSSEDEREVGGEGRARGAW